MLLYHGTDYDNAIKICNEQHTSNVGLWCTNDAQIALLYGKYLVCVHIPEGSYGVEVYPLSTGKLTDTLDWRSEPAEFRLQENMDIECNLVER